MEKHEKKKFLFPQFLADNYNACPPRNFERVARIICDLKDEFAAFREELIELRREKITDIKSLEDVSIVKSDVSDIKRLVPEVRSNLSESCSSGRGTALDLTDSAKAPCEVGRQTFSSVVRSPKAQDSTARALKPVLNNQTGNQKTPLNPLATSFNFYNTERTKRNFETRNSVFGTKINCSKFTGAPRILDVYIGRCNKDTVNDNIFEHCVEAGIRPVKCEALPIKSEWYCSFKLTVNASDRETLMTPDFWPDGIVARKYYRPRVAKRNSIDQPVSV